MFVGGAGVSLVGFLYLCTEMEETIEQAGLGLALRAALEAGRESMQISNDPKQDFGVERKADNSPLTLADRRAHEVIVRHLEATGLPILSEEGKHLPFEQRAEWERFWLVDPLDGTKEFIKKNGEFTVNIALVIDGRPHLGVVYAPALEALYFADPFVGARKVEGITEWAEGETLPRLVERSALLPLGRKDDEAYVVVCSRSHESAETLAFIDEARRRHPLVRTVPSGSSLKICLVAEGVADVYPRLAPTMEWDTGAGHAVALCAGKKVTSAEDGSPLVYNKADLHNPWFVVE